MATAKYGLRTTNQQQPGVSTRRAMPGGMPAVTPSSPPRATTTPRPTAPTSTAAQNVGQAAAQIYDPAGAGSAMQSAGQQVTRTPAGTGVPTDQDMITEDWQQYGQEYETGVNQLYDDILADMVASSQGRQSQFENIMSTAGRRAAELGPSGGGQQAAQLQAGTMAGREVAEIQRQDALRKAELGMTMLQNRLQQAEAAKDRNLQVAIQEMIQEMQLRIASIEAGAGDPGEGGPGVDQPTLEQQYEGAGAGPWRSDRPNVSGGPAEASSFGETSAGTSRVLDLNDPAGSEIYSDGSGGMFIQVEGNWYKLEGTGGGYAQWVLQGGQPGAVEATGNVVGGG